MLFRERQKDWSRGCLSPVFSEKKELRKLAKIPVVVGVTGHRDYLPEEREKLADLVRKELRAIRERCPHSPMVLLTSLAEGADQLAAEAALSVYCGLFSPEEALAAPLSVEHAANAANGISSDKNSGIILFFIPRPPPFRLSFREGICRISC